MIVDGIPPTTCKCVDAVCGHPNGEPCGKPVKNPLPTSDQNDEYDPPNGPEYLTGLCEDCWERLGFGLRQ
jgi:hypothetical protein